MGNYGRAHRKRAAELKAAMVDGDRCARCGRPMWRAQLRRIHADHVAVPKVFDDAGLPDALSHASCNESHGAALGNRLRGRRRARPEPRRPLPEW